MLSPSTFPIGYARVTIVPEAARTYRANFPDCPVDPRDIRQVLRSVEDLLAIAACQVTRGLTEKEMTQFDIATPIFDVARRQCPPPIGQ